VADQDWFPAPRLRENVIPALVAREVFWYSRGYVAGMAAKRCRMLGR
jgi:hypothetical protein